MPRSDRVAEVRDALRLVSDPELDESVVDLGFIGAIEVDRDHVAVRFRLPTFWCSASFAFIMAEDMAAALRALPWIATADIRLVDHFAAERINTGIAAGAGFASTFAGEAGGELIALRETFRRKAFLGRMSRLIDALRAAGWEDGDILALRVADLGRLSATIASDAEPELAALAARYLELRALYGGPSEPSDPAFRRPDGSEIAPDALPAFLRDIRMTRRGVEANGEMCRILLAGRLAKPVPA